MGTYEVRVAVRPIENGKPSRSEVWTVETVNTTSSGEAKRLIEAKYAGAVGVTVYSVTEVRNG